LLSIFDRIRAGQQVFACVEAPPRHAKSETSFHGIVRELEYAEGRKINAYISYGAEFARDQSRLIRDCALRAGLFVGVEQTANTDGFAKSAQVRFWETANGNRLIATGRDGQLVGKGLALAVFDDPYKNRKEAESAIVSEDVWTTYRSGIVPRMEPGGSIVVYHQRWNDSDLIARIRAEYEADPENSFPWEFYTYSAIQDDGTALWPERFDIKTLNKLRKTLGEYDWWSQYMQRPQPKGGRLFGEFVRFEGAAQVTGRRIVISVDPAGTEKTARDATAITIWAYWYERDEQGDLWPHMDLIRAYRIHREIPEVADLLRQLQQAYGNAPIVIETQGGDGRGISQTLARISKNISVIEVPATVSKFQRAQPASAAQKQGRIRLPMSDGGEGWLEEYLKEMRRVTGIGDKQDDQMDATVHAYNWVQLSGGWTPPKPSAKGRRMATNTGGY
jgi:predicted phage terminase large subunit-like protein